MEEAFPRSKMPYPLEALAAARNSEKKVSPGRLSALVANTA